MKTLNTSIGTFGPFQSVELLQDRYLCDNVEYPFSVVGASSVEDYIAPLPEPEKPFVPPSVSPRQIRQALTRTNMRTAVESAVAAGDQDTKDWWEFATEFQRAHPMVAAMGAGLGLTAEQIDSLWVLAGTL